MKRKTNAIVDKIIVDKVTDRFKQYDSIEGDFSTIYYEIFLLKTMNFDKHAKELIFNTVKLRIQSLRKIIRRYINKNERRIERNSIYSNEAIMSNHYLFFKLNILNGIESDMKIRLEKKRV